LSQARWLLGAILVLNAVALLLTYERTLWAAAAVACLVAVLKTGPDARRVAARWVPTGLVVLLIALIALGELRTAAERLVSVGQYSTDRALEHRLVESRNAIRAIGERPLTGSGFGATITWGRDDVFATQTTPFAHNGYLWLSWKTGIPAAFLFVLAIGVAVLGRGPPPHDARLAMLRTGSQAALLGLLMINVTFPAFNTLGITAVIGLMVAVCMRPREDG
jgi:O-antigen ligase